MLKILLRKQLLEFKKLFLYKRNKGELVADKSTFVARLILFIFMYLAFFGTFFALSFLIGAPLIAEDVDWVFFMIMSIMAFLFGVIGSGFSAAGALFQARDNDFLLAMPIPPSKILIARMFSVYVMGLIYESMILLPAVLCYFIMGHPTVWSVIFSVLGLFLLGLVILTFSCILGWLIALITSKLKNKSFLSVIVSVVMIALFMWLRFSANSLFKNLAAHGKDIGEAVEGWGYPIYSLGLGMSGDVPGFLVFVVIAAVLFGLTCLVMSKSFKKIVSTKNESIKGTFSEGQIRTRSLDQALRKKEMKRFTSSPGYMLNCALGTLFLVAGGVILLMKLPYIRTLADSLSKPFPMLGRLLPVLCVFAVCMLASLVDIAAPSISLEGQKVWILQSLPVDPYAVFKAKLYVHIVITIVPSLFCALALIIVFRTGILASIFMLLAVAAFVVLSASAMLALDIKRPMMEWANETQPIKQSLNILFSWLGGFLLSAILAGLYLLVSLFAGPEVYLIFCIAVFAFFTWLLHQWMRGKGRALFAKL